MTLRELYKEYGPMRYGEDKFGQHYADLYDVIFKPFQHEQINVFEVGYCNGGSARLWCDYFTNAKIRFIDIDPATIQRSTDHNSIEWLASNLSIDTTRVSVDILDANDLTPAYFEGKEPTIAIDDGSHKLEDQLAFVKLMYPIIKDGGYLIIEDIENIDKDRAAFEELGIHFNVADFRPWGNPEYDSVLVIYQK